MSPLLEVAQLYTAYQGKSMLKDINFSLESGKILGIVGESGSGKSTLLRAIIGLLGSNGTVTSGNLQFAGIDLLSLAKKDWRALRGKEIGMIFQNPQISFHPIRKIRAQFLEAMKSHGYCDSDQATDLVLETFYKIGLNDVDRVLDSYPFELSGGMNQRVAIALAMVLQPRLLLADEPTSALDVTVQVQCVKEFLDLRDRFDTAIIMVTHNMGIISYMADKIAVMYAGMVVEYGTKQDILTNSMHPYTRALIASIPNLKGAPPKGIPGQPPVLGEEFQGCCFAPRCALCSEICTEELPRLQFIDEHHAIRCYKYSEV